MKKLLVNGRRVVDRAGSIFIVFDHLLVARNGFTFISDIKDDLTFIDSVDNQWDIVEVYERPSSDCDLINLDIKGQLLWKRG